MATVGVLTVGHEEAFRRATRAAVEATPGFAPVGDAASAEEALESALALRPELALVAADMPAIDGAETTRMLKDVLPETVVILVHPEQELTPAHLRALWDEQADGRPT